MADPYYEVSAAGVAASITLAAKPGVIRSIDYIHCGYRDDPANGYILVESPVGTTRHRIPITSKGAAPFEFPRGLDGEMGEAVKITLGGGGGTVVGDLSVGERNN